MPFFGRKWSITAKPFTFAPEESQKSIVKRQNFWDASGQTLNSYPNLRQKDINGKFELERK